VGFSRKEQLLLLHFRDAQTSWCPSRAHREMDNAQYFGKPHLTSLLLPIRGVVGGEIAGKSGAEVNQLLPGLGEAELGCSNTIPPTPALRLVPALPTCPSCAQAVSPKVPFGYATTGL